MANANLDGLASEWEACVAVREFVRVKGCLIAPALRMVEPLCVVACGE